MAERLYTEDFYRLVVQALAPNGAASLLGEQPYFMDRIKELFRFARTLVKHPAYYYAFVPSYSGGSVGFVYLSNVPWQAGLERPYPPGQNDYLSPEVHRAAFALPAAVQRALDEPGS
jgi:spermidine synthase